MSQSHDVPVPLCSSTPMYYNLCAHLLYSGSIHQSILNHVMRLHRVRIRVKHISDITAQAACSSTNPVSMPDPIRIWSQSARKQWPEAGRIILAHRLASRPNRNLLYYYPSGQNLTQSARTKSDPGWFCTM